MIDYITGDEVAYESRIEQRFEAEHQAELRKSRLRAKMAKNRPGK